MHGMKDIDFMFKFILLRCLYVILTRNYASNHRLRAVVQATQCCDAVCECSMEIWIREIVELCILETLP